MSSVTSRLVLPTDYPRIKVVGSFEELVTTPLEGEINALCWERSLPGDFQEIVDGLGPVQGITPVEDERLRALQLSEAGRVAREILWEDLERLRALELEPSLDTIFNPPRDESGGPVPTDVSSFHADTATAPMETYLCTYVGATSELLRNDEARRHVDVPETRARLLAEYGGADDEGFAEYLADNFYDLHYAPLPGAQPVAFGIGNLWRVATDYPGNPVPPCIHRAPVTAPGSPTRLLLIS